MSNLKDRYLGSGQWQGMIRDIDQEEIEVGNIVHLQKT